MLCSGLLSWFALVPAANPRRVLREAGPSLGGRLLQLGAGLHPNAETDLQCQPSLLLPVHYGGHSSLRPLFR